MNNFCGPYAYAKLLGINTDEAAEILARQDWRYYEGACNGGKGKRSNRPVRGILGSAMRSALNATGKVIATIPRPGMTLKTFAAKKAKLGDDKVWMVLITGHFVLLRRGAIYDNKHPHGISNLLFWGANKRVREAICVDLWSDLNPYTGHYHP